MSKDSKRRGFTLVELLVCVAILALLVAIAIPRYRVFLVRSKRADTYVSLSSAHKAQTAYFSGVDHYLNMCSGIPCTSAESTQMNVQLGLSTTLLSGNGYKYDWMMTPLDPTRSSYELQMSADFLPPFGFPFYDMVIIGVNSIAQHPLACGGCGYTDGSPFLLMDEVTQKFHCQSNCW